MDHPDIEVITDHKFGQGIRATANISKGELIASFDGEFFQGESNEDFPESAVNHAITCAVDQARDSNGLARVLNHSCNPNVGVRGKFDLVTMRDIEAGEELCWDYNMSEDHDWQMECSCGASHCAGIVRGYRYLSEARKQAYRGYIADWIVEKYDLA
ncbi:MAG: SET domain-containing protein-lysine N-methyltransferase [Verrucomicrobiota bacterium]